ncbi:hypothetical protein C8A00DRAFT_34746 [Chaetomidium leptoderma]|uniref:Uncharacterized protein n=1 Tax=Chaetomidium leptoderma TaxID=669021 RepID=A0AAN6VJ74_9PEZI|nr:hypothetical protein C8A00DRAFT_34746 [Chaetomidium leptoderma]
MGIAHGHRAAGKGADTTLMVLKFQFGSTADARLMMTDPVDQSNTDTRAKWETIVKYVSIIGPAFIDHYYFVCLNDKGDEVYRPMDLAKEMTWEKIFEAFIPVERRMSALLERYSTVPVGEPERDGVYFKERGNKQAKSIGMDEMVTPRKPRKKKDTPAGPSPLTKKDVRKHELGTPSKVVKKATSVATPEEEPSGSGVGQEGLGGAGGGGHYHHHKHCGPVLFRTAVRNKTQISHLCHNPLCTIPAHVVVETPRENNTAHIAF